MKRYFAELIQQDKFQRPIKNNSLIHCRAVSTFKGSSCDPPLLKNKVNKLSQQKPLNLLSKPLSHKRIKVTPRGHKKEMQELRKSLDKVVCENKNLKTLSKEMMSSREESHSMVHSFYQNVILPDSKQDIEDLQVIIKQLKSKIIELMASNGKLRKENELLKGTIMRYKEVSARKAKSFRETLPQDKYSGQYSTRKQNPIRSVINNKDNKDQFINFLKSNAIFSKENVKLGMMGSALRRLAQVNTMKQLITTLYRELRILLKTCTTGVFIIDPDLQSIYQQEKGAVESITLDKSVLDFALTDLSLYPMKPLFNNISNSIIRKPDAVSIPINDLRNGEETYLIVQLESTQNEIKSFGNKEQWVILPCIEVVEERDNSVDIRSQCRNIST